MVWRDIMSAASCVTVVWCDVFQTFSQKVAYALREQDQLVKEFHIRLGAKKTAKCKLNTMTDL